MRGGCVTFDIIRIGTAPAWRSLWILYPAGATASIPRRTARTALTSKRREDTAHL